MGLVTSLIVLKDHGRMKNLDQDHHTQYQKEAEKDAANGYAGLDADARMLLAQFQDMAAGSVYRGQGLGSDPAVEALPVFDIVKKTADETVNNSTTSQNDDHLYYSVAANKVYAYRLSYMWHSAGAIRPKCDFAFPAGATNTWVAIFRAASTEHSERIANEQVTNMFEMGADTYQHIEIWGIIATAGTAGTLQLRWAQNAAVAADLTGKKGSLLEVLEVV